MINWNVFFDNTDSRILLIDFANRHASSIDLENECKGPSKQEVKKMRRLGVHKSRLNARKALSRRGIMLKRIYP